MNKTQTHETFRGIDLSNYQIIDLLFDKTYSLTFFKYFTGVENSKYIDEAPLGGIFLKLYKDKANYIHNMSKFDYYYRAHPLSPLKDFMHSTKELENNSVVYEEYLKRIYLTMDTISEYPNLSGLRLNKKERFAVIKNELLNLFIEPEQTYGIEDPLRLQRELKYIKVNIKPKDNPRDKIYDDYSLIEARSSIEIAESLISFYFKDYTEKFKEELLKVGSKEYEYFDEVLSLTLADYKTLIRYLSYEEGYFVPIIKIFRNHYLSFFRHILSDYAFYLNKEQKHKLEQEVTPRTYIRTLSLNFPFHNNHFQKNRIKKFTNSLIQMGYIEKEDEERFFLFFQGQRSIDGLINWKHGIGTLYTLIKMLKEIGLISNNNCWEITSRYFKVRDNIISISQLRDSKFSKNKRVLKQFNEIISELNKSFSQ